MRRSSRADANCGRIIQPGLTTRCDSQRPRSDHGKPAGVLRIAVRGQGRYRCPTSDAEAAQHPPAATTDRSTVVTIITSSAS